MIRSKLGDATLLLIDFQNEYLAGPLALRRAWDALDQAVRLVWAAREAGARVVHVAHNGRPDDLFDRTAYRGAFIAATRPLSGETIIEEDRANAFADTSLATVIGPTSSPLIIAGFMTHNCVSSTTRAASDLGYRVTVAADACTTRDLPWDGGVLEAEAVHRAELAALADSHAWVRTVDAILAEQHA